MSFWTQIKIEFEYRAQIFDFLLLRDTDTLLARAATHLNPKNNSFKMGFLNAVIEFYFGMVPKRYFDKRDRRDTCVSVL